jgi:hypothetical protein
MRSSRRPASILQHPPVRPDEPKPLPRDRASTPDRHVLCKKLTTRSLPEIGRKFGGRDHTTILHGVRKIEELIQVDNQIAEDAEILRRMLEA